MSKEPWVVFYYKGWEELAAYTLRGTFADECMETKKLLAAQHGVSEEDISVVIETRMTKGRGR